MKGGNMGRKTKAERADARRNTTKVMEAYKQVVDELGDVVHEIGRTNLYKRISRLTGLSLRAVAYKMNHG